MIATETTRESSRSFAADSSSNRTAKRLHDPALSNRAFAIFFIVTILIALALLLAPKTRAATTYTWDGNGTNTGNGKWSTVANWDAVGKPPLDGSPNGTGLTTTDVVFAGTFHLTPAMDATYIIHSLTFDSTAGAFNLTSNGAETLTIGTGGITNNSSNTETITSALILGGAQTWNAASGALTINSATVTNGGFLLTISGASNTSIAGVISGTGGLTKTGSGTLTVTGANTYSGATIISASGGTLKIDNNNSTTTGRLTATTDIKVNSGGTLLLAQSSGGTANNDRINNSATMTLNANNSSTVAFNTGGLSEHGASNNTAGIGALTLQSTSIIDMGNAASIVAFADSHSATWSGTLKIYNWSGTPNSGNGTDQLYFGSNNTTNALSSGQLADIIFYSDAGVIQYGGGTTIQLASGEVVPVPEPSTWLGGALAVGLLGWSQRRRFARLVRRRA